ASELLQGAPLSRAVQLVSRLTWLYGIYAAVIVVLLPIHLLPFKGPAKLVGLSRELAIGGLGETGLGVVLLVFFAMMAAGLLTGARLWRRRVETAMAAGEIDNAPLTLLAIAWKRGPGFLARQGQAVLLPLAALIVVLLAWLMWPKAGAPAAVSNDANLIAALIIGLAFPALIAERMMAGFPREQMPEAPGLRRLLLLATLILAVSGLAEIGRGLHYGWTVWIQRGLSLISVVVAIEIAVRSLGRLFLPEPSPDTAKAATDSLIATVLTAGPRSPGNLIRTHLGLDFARSWALSFLTAAAVPALTVTFLFCWMLTGVKLLGPDQRGVYERFGAPISVLKPGFHMVMPWPMGRLRPVEYGAIHTIATGVFDANGAEKGAQAVAEAAKLESISAEASPTAAMSRGWETAHATQATYLVADESGDARSFQAVNTEILVLYRTGLTDQAARDAVYRATSQAQIVEQESNRLALRYFSSHTLTAVLGASRENLQETLKAELSQSIDSYHAGVEIMAVLVNEIHPPAGAAEAYHHVQAAGILANTTAFLARAHAERVKGQAQQEAYQATSAATGQAVTRMQQVTGDAARFTAERQAYALSPSAFLLERRSRNLVEGLRGRQVMIVDHNLPAGSIPLIDMRSVQAAPAGAPATSTSPYVPDLPRSTSTERGLPE
ncbi:MAG: SPFH domain-containing protein, partial [Alphaproteobacteria bacterium]